MNKKVIILVLVFAVFLTCVFAAPVLGATSGQPSFSVYANHNFDDYSVRAGWKGIAIPPYWWEGTKKGGFFTSADAGAPHNGVVRFTTTNVSADRTQTPEIIRTHLDYAADPGDFVLSFEINPKDYNASDRLIRIIDVDGNTHPLLHFEADGTLRCEFFNNQGSGANNVYINTSADKYSINRWTKVDIVYFDSLSKIDVYIDGVQNVAKKFLNNGRVRPKIKQVLFRVVSKASAASTTDFDNFALYPGSTVVNQSELESNGRFPNTQFDYEAQFDAQIQNSTVLHLNSSNAYINGVRRKLDPSDTELRPLNVNGISYFPFKFACEAFGADTRYDSATDTVIAAFPGTSKEIRIKEGAFITYIDGDVSQTVRVISDRGKAFVPLSYLGQFTGINVNYNDNGVVFVGGGGNPFNLPSESKKFEELRRKLLYNFPTTNEIKELYQAKTPTLQHPNIFADAADFARLRSMVQTDSKMAAWYNQIKTSASSLASNPTPYPYLLESDDTMVGRMRTIKDRLEKWALVYQISADPIEKKKYSDRAWIELNNLITNYPDWNFMHFLDPSEMSVGVAIAYDWMYDGWTPTQRQQLYELVKRFAFEPVIDSYTGKRNPDWVNHPNNWSFVCHGSMITSALVFFDNDPDYCAQIIEWALHSWENSLHLFAPDGAWEEGVTYYDYAMRYYVRAIDTMLRYLGTDYGYFFNIEGAVKSAYFPPYMTGQAGQFNFHDADETPRGMSEHFWLANKTGDSNLAKYHLDNLNKGINSNSLVYDFLWYDPRNIGTNVSLGLDALYNERVTTATFRSSWDNDNGFFAGIHGGYNNVNHGHLDIGSFVIDAMGERWAFDLGKDGYNLTEPQGGGYLDNPNYYRKRAEGHNTVIVDPPSSTGVVGGKLYDQDQDATGVIEKYVSKSGGGFVIMDMAQTNKAKISSGKRGLFLLPGRKQLILQDEFTLKQNADLYWFMHTKATVALENNNKRAVLTQNGKSMKVDLVSDDSSLVFEVMNAVPLAVSPNPVGQNPNTGYRKLVIKCLNKSNFNIMVAFTQSNASAALPAKTPLSEWSVSN